MILRNIVTVKITCPDPSLALQTLSQAGITLWDAETEDEFTLSTTLRLRDLKSVRRISDRKGYELDVVGQDGLYWHAKAILGRPVLSVGLLLLILFSIYLSNRILFIRVEGNSNVPSRLILEVASQWGVRFGGSTKALRSQTIKDGLLEAIPQLRWAGIRSRGCVITITVSEQDSQLPQEVSGISSIVAARDGVITSITATSGSPACKVGQAVRAGELLISGYTDCGICIRAEQAEGEVYAQTNRELTAVLPAEWKKSGKITAVEKKYALIIGKKRINFYKDSGILGTSCDKMYTEYVLTLPGGFQLPVALVVEVYTYREESVQSLVDAQAQLESYSAAYLTGQMTAGTILQMDTDFISEDNRFTLKGHYACSEMIGRARYEEIIKPNGNNK